MTQDTLDLIHRSYQDALEKSSNIIQIVENLYLILENAEVKEQDSKQFDAFIDGLRNCVRTRKMTSDMTDVVIYITIVIMHIIQWLNESKQIDIDIILNGRRKSLESDLTKLLRKSTETLSAKIRDRFGLRGTILNQPEEVAIEYISIIYDSVTGILAGKNRKMRKDFCDWIENGGYVNPLNKVVIKEFLTIPFDVDDSSIKNYIGKDNMKANGYQSFHFTLVIQPYSKVLPGGQLEIQLRTKKMDTEARLGSASHSEYKKYYAESSKEENPLLNVFVVDDFSKIHIPGFSSYDSREDDEDGIHYYKGVTYRRNPPKSGYPDTIF